jgi:cyanate lyase
MPELTKNLAQLCLERQIDWRTVAARSGVDEQRVMAIVVGRWTPSPEDRDAIAAVFGLARDQIAWGHKTPIQHIYGQGPA